MLDRHTDACFTFPQLDRISITTPQNSIYSSVWALAEVLEHSRINPSQIGFSFAPVASGIFIQHSRRWGLLIEHDSPGLSGYRSVSISRMRTVSTS